MLIDTHAHLEEIENLEEVLTRARGAGLDAVVAVGQDDASNKALLKIQERSEKIIKVCPALGIHPGRVEECELMSALLFIEENISGLVAVGEIGLDFWYKQARRPGEVRDLQIEIFRKQLVLAARYDKPVIVHSRGAWRESLDVVQNVGSLKVDFHWYSGPLDILDEIVKSGYYISATPSAEYSKEHRDVLAHAPLTRILFETDSPVRFKPRDGTYCAEPKDVLRTLRAVAQIKKCTQEEIERIAESNARAFFNLG